MSRSAQCAASCRHAGLRACWAAWPACTPLSSPAFPHEARTLPSACVSHARTPARRPSGMVPGRLESRCPPAAPTLRGTGCVTLVVTHSLSLVICPRTLTFSLHVTRGWAVTNRGGHATLLLPGGERSLPKVTSACPTCELHLSLIRFKGCVGKCWGGGGSA